MQANPNRLQLIIIDKQKFLNVPATVTNNTVLNSLDSRIKAALH